MPRDKGHGFLMVTFTRALRRNITKRLQKANIEIMGVDVRENSDQGQVFLNELCLNLEPCDLVLNCPVISNALSILSLKPPPSDLYRRSKLRSPPDGTTMLDNDAVMPLLPANILPLLYINASNFRLFVPTCTSPQKAEGQGQHQGQLLAHDVCVLQISAVSLVPQAENPLPRIVVDREIYRRAVHSGITQMSGSEVEDRQYQLDISGLSLSTGVWCLLVTG